MTYARPSSNSSSDRIAVPILPPIWASCPAERRRCEVSAVVVDLPLVPVMATNGAVGATRRRWRQNRSMSPMTSTPAACASAADQCGAGCVSGTPGASTSAATRDQSTSRRSAVGMPALVALTTDSALSSQPMTSAPPASSALALASPEPPRPKTATFSPAKTVTGIMRRRSRRESRRVGEAARKRAAYSRGAPPYATRRSPQLQRGESSEREHDRNDPEADHDLGFGPAELLEMVVDRRHAKHALAGQLERKHSHYHRHGLQHEQSAHHREHDLMLGGDRNRADHTAERERSGVAHEDRGGRRVEPQESQSGTDHGSAQHRQFAGARDVVDVEVVREERVAREIGDEAEAQRDDDHGHGREPIEAVGQIHGVAGADDDERAKDDEEPAERKHQLLEERKRQRAREWLAADRNDEIDGSRADQRLDQQAKLARKSDMGLLRHLEVVVVEADRAERKRHAEHDPDVAVVRIGPQRGRDQHPEQDHQPAHGRRALLGDQVGLRSVAADRLALALPQPQLVDDRGPEQEHEHKRRDHRSDGAERDVAQHIEGSDRIRERGEQVEHGFNRSWSELARAPHPASRAGSDLAAP